MASSLSFTQSVVVVFIFHTVKIGNLTEVSVTEMPASDTVFQEVLEIDTRRSFFPSPFSAPGNQARTKLYTETTSWISGAYENCSGMALTWYRHMMTVHIKFVLLAQAHPN